MRQDGPSVGKNESTQTREDQQARLVAAYANRWWNLLPVAAQNVLAASLANDKSLLADGVDGEEPDWLGVLYESLCTSTHAHGGNTGNGGSTDPLEVVVIPAWPCPAAGRGTVTQVPQRTPVSKFVVQAV